MHQVRADPPRGPVGVGERHPRLRRLLHRPAFKCMFRLGPLLWPLVTNRNVAQDLLCMDMLRQGFDDVMGMCQSGEYDVRNMLQYGHNYGSQQFNHSLATFLAHEVSCGCRCCVNGYSQYCVIVHTCRFVSLFRLINSQAKKLPASRYVLLACMAALC